MKLPPEYVAAGVHRLRNRSLAYRKWKPSDALVSRDGVTEKYSGQSYETREKTLVTGGFGHDTCRLCHAIICDPPLGEVSDGYTDGNEWVCTACYAQHLVPTHD